MKCTECRDALAAYLEGLLDPADRAGMEAHMNECSSCRAELEETRELTARLEREGLAASPVSLETQVMDQILRQQAAQLRRLKMRKRIRILEISGAMAAAIALLLVGGFWLAQPATAEAERAAEVLAQGAEATPSPSTVHILARLRTVGHDNFVMIGDKYDFVPVEIWKQFGDQPKWRVQKPGRVAVMDSKSTTMLIRPDYVFTYPHPSSAAFDTGWLLALTEVQDMITHELRSAQAKRWDLKLAHQTTAAGEQVVVTVEAKSRLPADDYLKNKSFYDADMRRVYRFDEKTKRLVGFDAYLHRKEGEVLILTVERIDYDQPIDPAVFTIKMPEKVQLYHEPERLADNARYEKMTPEEAARAFFTACEKKDWKEVEKFLWPCDERLRHYLGGLKLIHLGKPFQSKGYGGWFVPYEIKLSSQVPFKVCRSKAVKRWVVLGPDAQVEAKRLAELKPLADGGKYEKLKPKEALEAFFAACKKKDWKEAGKFLIDSTSGQNLEKEMGSLATMDVHVGEPTPAKDADCWDVPVQISVTKKHNLALRSDNPAKRFVVDGGY
jgi:outer membrane lipoprotein-sorting protein